MSNIGKINSNTDINQFITIDPCNGEIKFDFKQLLKLLLSLCLIRLPSQKRPPKGLITVTGKLKPGVSKRKIAQNIIKRQTEAGLPEDTGGVHEALELIRVEEIFNELIENAVINVEIQPGAMVIGTATTPYGPAPVTAKVVDIQKGNGAIL